MKNSRLLGMAVISIGLVLAIIGDAVQHALHPLALMVAAGFTATTIVLGIVILVGAED